MLIQLDKILQNRIYFSSTLQCNPSIDSGKYYALAYDPADENGFNNLLKAIKFMPKGKEYVYYPASIFNPTSFAPMPSTKAKAAFYEWLDKNHPASHTKMNQLTLSESQQADHNPVLLNLASYFTVLDPYAEQHKNSASNKYKYFKMVLAKILPKYSEFSKEKMNLLIDISGTVTSSFLFFILYGLRHDYEAMTKAFEGINVIFVDGPHGLFMKPDLADRKKVQSNLNLIAKMLNMSRNFDRDAIMKDKDVSITDESVAVSSDKVDQKTIDAAIAGFDIDRTTELEGQTPEQIMAAKTKRISIAEKDPSDIASVTVANESDLEEILGSVATDDFQKVAKANQDFLNKYAPVQEKAISKARAEAEKAFTDSKLSITKAVDSSVMNSNVKSSVIAALTSSYYRKIYKKDILSIFTNLNNDPDHPVVITSFEMKDNSDPLNMLDELSVQFLDKNGKRHTFTVDVPKVSHDGFLYLNGNKKFVTKQAALLPIIKEAPNRVQITTNYKKTFLYRKNDKTSGIVDRILKTLVGKKIDGVKQISGNSFASNLPYNVSIPYNLFGRRLYSVEIQQGTSGGNVLHLVFNQNKIREDMKDLGFDIEKLGDHAIPVAFRCINNKIETVYCEMNTRSGKIIGAWDRTGKPKQENYKNITQFMADQIRNSGNSSLIEAFNSTSAGKSLGQTEIRLAGRMMSLGVLLCFYRGMLPLLEQYGIKYTVSDKGGRATDTQTILRFKDVSLIIDAEGDTTKELIVNGFYYLNTKEYNLDDAGQRGAVYIEYFGEYTGSRNTAKAVLNFESAMIDPITLEVLKDLHLPTTFVDLLLYGNTMLGDFTHKSKNDMSNFRTRDAEVVSVAVYNTLITAFNEYKRTVKTGVVTSISAPRDAVTKTLQTYQNIEGYSTLSPFLEIQNKAKTTFKGPSGLNSDDSYTADMRAFDESMVGGFGIFTPVSAQVGIARSMTLNPRINHVRGYLEKKNVNDMNMDELYAPGELLNIFVASHSDPMRICMATTQGGHIIATKVQHNYLIGTGIDKTLSHLVGQDFAFKASEDGVVSKVDETNKLVFLKYASGETTAIDISDKPANNSAGGFYMKNQLELTDGLKVGSKFKVGQILATNRQFFKEDMDGSHGFAAGRLTKVALMCLTTTYEDSMPITDTVRREMASTIISEKETILKENSRIHSIAKEGQYININEPLVIFEEIGDTEKAALSAVEKASNPDFGKGSELEYLGKNVVKSKYAGLITNIKVYYNCDLESPTLEPTLKEYLQGYIESNKRRSGLLKGIKADELIEQASTERIMKDKILGNEMQGVLIVFYIQHEEDSSIGNKLTFFSAAKGIVSEVIPDELAPYTDYRPKDPIEAILSPMSLISRNVPDLMLTGLSNRVIVELRKQVLEDLGLIPVATA
jgi:hypothetical protein